jgi:hypothetical protein
MSDMIDKVARIIAPRAFQKLEAIKQLGGDPRGEAKECEKLKDHAIALARAIDALYADTRNEALESARNALEQAVDRFVAIQSHQDYGTRLPSVQMALVHARGALTSITNALKSAAPSPVVEEKQEHEWFRPNFISYDCCRKCGIVRRADGNNKPCKGFVYLRALETPFTGLEYSGWLIERSCPDGIEYVHTFAEWTRDANKALRFNRKGDAEDTVQVFFDEVDGIKVVEHAWDDGKEPALRALQAPAQGDADVVEWAKVIADELPMHEGRYALIEALSSASLLRAPPE